MDGRGEDRDPPAGAQQAPRESGRPRSPSSTDPRPSVAEGPPARTRSPGASSPPDGTVRSTGAPGPADAGPPSRRPALVAPILRALVPAAVLVLLWQGAVTALAPPRYLLPSPVDVAMAFAASGSRILGEAAVTLAEAVLGLACGIVAGIAAGLAAAASPLAGRVLTPVLVASQALPVFALAPLLVIWFGFGLASKVVMASVAIFFPVASGLADGLARTDPGLLDLARLNGAGRLSTLFVIRLPAALPALVSGIRVAAVFAPIGAVIGEWVGASRGLGLLMVQANARMQTDLLFAALVVLAVAALALKAIVDRATAALIPWAEAPAAERLP